jgi:Flp pilus assembly pilin Flp
MKPVPKLIGNNKGQSLVEYLIIVALVGVGAMAVMRSVGQNVNVQFAKVVKALGGEVQGNTKASAVTEKMYQKRDLRNFVRGATGSTNSKDDSTDD